MKDFLFLFRNDFRDTPMDPASNDAHMQRWGEWLQKLAQEGLMVRAEPLAPEGRTISAPQMLVSDGPFAESKEMVGGYLICKARDFDHAVEISKTCPIFELPTANIEIRPIMGMPGN